MNEKINQLLRSSISGLGIVLGLSVFFSASVLAQEQADTLIPPEDPKQSITYWKKYTLDSDAPTARQAQQVFNVLLRAWDQSRIEPGLFVVESEVGAWAASLADGNILLSKQAVETSFSYGRQRGEHLLAFILAHELAHQRADDLWHQRFFRMIGSQPAESQKTMMAGLELDQQNMTQLEQKEAQADHDGLVLMSSVGFDPYQIVQDKDFFTLWVENIWHQNCIESDEKSSHYAACRQAMSRALRTRTQLKTVATQSMLYELGVQAFVAEDYEKARGYFMTYGRDYPGRTVISAIGLTYFAQAQKIQQRLIALNKEGNSGQLLNFYYPMMLEAQIFPADSSVSSNNKRADIEQIIADLQVQEKRLLELSVSQFEKAIRLSPDYRPTYLLLASAHLLANNSYLVRGVLQGRYKPDFGDDASVTMLLALTTAIEGDRQHAIATLQQLAQKIKSKQIDSVLPETLMTYSVFYNLSTLLDSVGRSKEAKDAWKVLTKLSNDRGDTLLFRLAINHLRDNRGGHNKKLKIAPSISGNRLGDKIRQDGKGQDLWIDGERFQVIEDNGSRYVVRGDGLLISASQMTAKTNGRGIDHRLNIGDPADRPFKSLGIPDRRLNMTSGDYLAYDDYGLAIRISNNQVKGWFLYDAQ